MYGYNSLENPIGIETAAMSSRVSRTDSRYNSLENPIGIETRMAHAVHRRGGRYNSLENPIGIETVQ